MNCVPLKLHFMHYGSNLSYYRKFPMVPKTATLYISNLHHHWLSHDHCSDQRASLGCRERGSCVRRGE